MNINKLIGWGICIAIFILLLGVFGVIDLNPGEMTEAIGGDQG